MAFWEMLQSIMGYGYPPGVCPMAFWVMLQSIMGYGYPPLWTDRWKDRHVSKHYLPVVLRTRAVNMDLYLLLQLSFPFISHEENIVSVKIWPNNRLAPSLGLVPPSGKSWIRHCLVNKYRYQLCANVSKESIRTKIIEQIQHISDIILKRKVSIVSLYYAFIEASTKQCSITKDQ